MPVAFAFVAFAGLLDSYPKRTDLWSVYFDAGLNMARPLVSGQFSVEPILVNPSV